MNTCVLMPRGLNWGETTEPKSPNAPRTDQGCILIVSTKKIMFVYVLFSCGKK